MTTKKKTLAMPLVYGRVVSHAVAFTPGAIPDQLRVILGRFA